jgi:uncharacterized membrane protein YhaH (DUF805 family)
MSKKVFISYRRDDTSGIAGRISDLLRNFIPGEDIFIDVDGIAPGENFAQVIRDRICESDVILVLIGNSWLAGDGNTASAPRLSTEGDFVRLEIETALANSKRVIPVLVDGASMPSPTELPSSVRPLTLLQAVEISHKKFGLESTALLSALEVSKRNYLGGVNRGRSFVDDLLTFEGVLGRAWYWRYYLVLHFLVIMSYFIFEAMLGNAGMDQRTIECASVLLMVPFTWPNTAIIAKRAAEFGFGLGAGATYLSSVVCAVGLSLAGQHHAALYATIFGAMVSIVVGVLPATALKTHPPN